VTFGARLGLLRGRAPVSDDAQAASRTTAFAQRLSALAPSQARAQASTSPGFDRRVFVLSGDWSPASPLPARLDAHAVPDAAALERAARVVGGDDRTGGVFLDLETTGLGSASRTLAFIVGMVHAPAPGQLELVQWTLSAPAAERAMLGDVVATLDHALERAPMLVTFNGASFDVPLLLGRLRRLRVQTPERLARVPHLDLLHVARRLAEADLPDRRLGTLEQAWLGIRRAGDLDGAEIASVFEQYARHGDVPWVRARLEQATAHNRLDLITLAILVGALADRLGEPPDAASAVRAARHFARSNQKARALACLRPWVEAWRATPAPGPIDVACAREAAELLRRIGAVDDAVRLWWWLCTHGGDDGWAHEALAKDLEHRRRRPAEALAVAQASPAPCPRRLARLRRKVAAQKDAAREARAHGCPRPL
jgi:uncharacterized protein